MKKIFILLLLFVFCICSFYLSAEGSYRDEYKAALVKKDTAAMIQSLKYLGDSLSEEADYRSGDSILMKAVHLSEITKDKYETGIIYNLLASNASYSGDRPQAMIYYHKALKEFYEIKDADKVAMIMMNMGSEYEYAGNLKLAIAYKLKALKNKLASGKTKNLDYYYQNIGQLFKETDIDKWEFYTRKAYDISNTIPDGRIQTKAAIFNDLGGISKTKGNNSEALAWYDSLLIISTANNYMTGLGTGYSNRCLVYMAEERYDEALKDALMAVEIATKTGKVYAQILDRIHTANILEKMNDFRRAGVFAREALDKAHEMKYYPEEEAQAHLALARIGEKTQNWKSAYEHYNAYKEGIDSLRNADVEKSLHDLEVKYRTSEKEKEIERLDHENKLQTLTLQRTRTQITGLILVGLLIAAVVFLWSRRKLSENRKQQAELREKLLRSQMNPHFIFNTLNAINQYIQTDKSNEASAFLTRYARLMRQILENSNEKLIQLSDEIEFLNNYLKMQQLRFGQSFEFEISIAGDIDPENTEIPPMIAQPFIENAVEHGIRGVQNGKIEVVFSLQGKELILTVTDNGLGIQSKDAGKTHRSMAIDITRGRLQMTGGRPESLQFESPVAGSDAGTRVSLSIPFKSYNE